MTYSIKKIVGDKIMLNNSSVWRASIADSTKLLRWSPNDQVEMANKASIISVRMTNLRRNETISVSSSSLGDSPTQTVSVLAR